mgnify:CR=1 FL=1
MTYPDLFKKRYQALHGKDWLRRIEPDDKAAFVRLGMEAHDYGRMGGKARAESAKRDEKGRFAK